MYHPYQNLNITEKIQETEYKIFGCKTYKVFKGKKEFFIIEKKGKILFKLEEEAVFSNILQTRLFPKGIYKNKKINNYLGYRISYTNLKVNSSLTGQLKGSLQLINLSGFENMIPDTLIIYQLTSLNKEEKKDKVKYLTRKIENLNKIIDELS